jgi:hypothetical protein
VWLTRLIRCRSTTGRRLCALARPSCASEERHSIGRDVGLAESGFALPIRIPATSLVHLGLCDLVLFVFLLYRSDAVNPFIKALQHERKVLDDARGEIARE